MSDTARATVAQVLAVIITLNDFQQQRVLGYAEGMAASNSVRDQPEAARTERSA